MHDSDRAAAALAGGGNGDAFRALVERHSRQLYQVAYRLTGSVADAEDVVQETFLKAHRQLRRFEGRADVRTWLHRIAVNCAIDLIRSRERREVGTDPADLEIAAGSTGGQDPPLSPDRLAHSREIGEQVAAALGGLSALERAAFVLRHVEGLSIREIGSALGLRREATKHAIFRAVRKMRAALEPLVGTREREDATGVAQRPCI